MLHRGGSVVNHPPSFVETSIAAVFDAESTRILIPLFSVDLNNTPPSLTVTTTAVESSSTAITGAEFFDTAPFDAEEV